MSKGKGAGGLGNPHEEDFFYEGFRDTGQAEGRQRDVVFDPSKAPVSDDPKNQQFLDDLFNRLREEAKNLVIFSKRPAFVEPPFFSKPIIKVKSGLVVAPGTTGTIFDWLIQDRQKIMLTMLGVDLAPLQPLLNGQLEFWFQANSDILTVFDDQTPTAYGGTVPLLAGKTTVIPGSVETPFCFMTNGLSFSVKGPRNFQFRVENKSGVPVTFRGLMGFYQYWMGAKAGSSEFESQDLQV